MPGLPIGHFPPGQTLPQVQKQSTAKPNCCSGLLETDMLGWHVVIHTRKARTV